MRRAKGRQDKFDPVFDAHFKESENFEGNYLYPSYTMSFMLLQVILFCPLALQQELDISLNTSCVPTCTLYLIHHGSTDWSEEGRLQGWKDVPLNAHGKAEIARIDLQEIAAIYASPQRQAKETAAILQEKLHCPVIEVEALRGEFHGQFEGYTIEQYSAEPHFQRYDRLSSEEEFFFPCGEGGESKAEMARRLFPALKIISARHLGEKVVVVTHGGLFKVLNFYLGKGTEAIPNGSLMVVQGDAEHIFLCPCVPIVQTGDD